MLSTLHKSKWKSPTPSSISCGFLWDPATVICLFDFIIFNLFMNVNDEFCERNDFKKKIKMCWKMTIIFMKNNRSTKKVSGYVKFVNLFSSGNYIKYYWANTWLNNTHKLVHAPTLSRLCSCFNLRKLWLNANLEKKIFWEWFNIAINKLLRSAIVYVSIGLTSILGYFKNDFLNFSSSFWKRVLWNKSWVPILVKHFITAIIVLGQLFLIFF